MDHDQFEAAMAERMKLSNLPDELKSFVRSVAWERGHSSGYEEVLLIANDLADELGDAFKKYEQRIGR